MRKLFVFLLPLFICISVQAATVSGTIKEKNGSALAFSSILVKGTTQGVSANTKGIYMISLEPGEYVLVCQYIGHKTLERKIKVSPTLFIIPLLRPTSLQPLQSRAI